MKLAPALEAFAINPTGMACADLGCHVGGFTDCLLQHGAASVHAVDTGYGVLAWKLRQDERVVVLERTNVLHFSPGDLEGFTGCDLVVMDLGWTRQHRAVPAALPWLKGGGGKAITLIKPQYEQGQDARGRGVLDDDNAAKIAEQVIVELPQLGVRVVRWMPCPVRGGGSRRGKGNLEFLALLVPEAPGGQDS
jgi:23S rRNA (cytidine1920-2'-O)/16S rRNA (cytidine1409-2'-O)-methyltransferase